MARTRSASAHQKVLDAAIELVAERGVEATSMDAIAGKSGVSKATIYKHWADKDALLLDILAEVHGLHGRPAFDSGNTYTDIVAVLAYRPQENADMRERITPRFMAYSASNASFGMAWRKMVMEPPVRELKRLIQLGMQKGELKPGLDVEFSVGLLLGPIIYWKVFLSSIPEDPKSLVEGVADAFWKAFGLKSRSSKHVRAKPLPSRAGARLDDEQIRSQSQES
jgi:AcrR family transcriptional regulator